MKTKFYLHTWATMSGIQAAEYRAPRGFAVEIILSGTPRDGRVLLSPDQAVLFADELKYLAMAVALLEACS